MDKVLHDRVYTFLKQELVDQELNGLVVKQLDKKTYKISTYRLSKDSAIVETSTGQIYQFLSLTPAVVYCCLMSINRLDEAYIIHTLNDEIIRLGEKTYQLRKKIYQTKSNFTRDVLVSKLLQFETQFEGRIVQMKKNIARAKYIIKPGHPNGS